MIGRLLGIDHGLKRIGVATSDALGIVATEYAIIERKSRQEDFARIREIAANEGAAAIVVGIPYSEGHPGAYTQADAVRLWISRLRDAVSLPVVEWDEQLTSQEAREIARTQGRKASDPVDDLAARVILQSYLNALHDGLASPPDTSAG